MFSLTISIWVRVLHFPEILWIELLNLLLSNWYVLCVILIWKVHILLAFIDIIRLSSCANLCSTQSSFHCILVKSHWTWICVLVFSDLNGLSSLHFSPWSKTCRWFSLLTKPGFEVFISLKGLPILTIRAKWALDATTQFTVTV